MDTLSNAAILAIHFQRDVVDADGAFANFFAAEAERRGVVAQAARLIDAAHVGQHPVVFTRVGWDAGHATLVANTPLLQTVAQQGCLTNGTRGVELVDGIEPADDDLVLTNGSVSAFGGSPLDTLLRERGVRTLVVFGVATNVSVESTVRAAADLGYRVIVVGDACSTTTSEAHDASLASLSLFGEIVTSDEMVRRLA